MLPTENPFAGKFDHLGFVEITDWFYDNIDFPKGLNPTESCLSAHLEKGLTKIALSVGRSTVYYHSKNPLITRAGGSADLSKPVDGLDENHRRCVKLLREECCLQSALRYGQARGMTIYAHLCMARNYTGYGGIFSAALARDENNLEVMKSGQKDPLRFCYAVPAVREERKAVIQEVVEAGANGVCLDFVRQPPIAQYHPVMTEEFKKTRGVEPAEIHIRDNPGQFKEWIKFRAGYITAFMEDVKAMIRGLETRLGRRIETMVRLPDDGFTANMIAGLDIVEWCERGLVDSVAVHPLQWIHGIWQHDAAPYVDIGRLTGVKVLGGVNMYPVERGFGQNPAAIARRILDQYEKGVAGISMYETNDSVTRPELGRLLPAIHTMDDLRALLADRDWVAAYPLDGFNVNCGMDNHSGFSRTPLMDL